MHTPVTFSVEATRRGRLIDAIQPVQILPRGGGRPPLRGTTVCRAQRAACEPGGAGGELAVGESLAPAAGGPEGGDRVARLAGCHARRLGRAGQRPADGGGATGAAAGPGAAQPGRVAGVEHGGGPPAGVGGGAGAARPAAEAACRRDTDPV